MIMHTGIYWHNGNVGCHRYCISALYWHNVNVGCMSYIFQLAIAGNVIRP